jgi:fructose transport system ATP-binding protein
VHHVARIDLTLDAESLNGILASMAPDHVEVGLTAGRTLTIRMQDLKVGIRSMTQAVETLSGGQRQCVAVARAAAFAEHVVILDEPTAALGVKEGNMVLELIRRIRDKGLPVILISHNMPHVFEIADRIHVARLGRRAAILNPKKIGMSDTVAVMTGAMPPNEIPTDCLAH